MLEIMFLINIQNGALATFSVGGVIVLTGSVLSVIIGMPTTSNIAAPTILNSVLQLNRDERDLNRMLVEFLSGFGTAVAAVLALIRKIRF